MSLPGEPVVHETLYPTAFMDAMPLTGDIAVIYPPMMYSILYGWKVPYHTGSPAHAARRLVHSELEPVYIRRDFSLAQEEYGWRIVSDKSHQTAGMT